MSMPPWLRSVVNPKKTQAIQEKSPETNQPVCIIAPTADKPIPPACSSSGGNGTQSDALQSVVINPVRDQSKRERRKPGRKSKK